MTPNYDKITQTVAKKWGYAPYPHARVIDRYYTWLKWVKDINSMYEELCKSDLPIRQRRLYQRELERCIRRRDKIAVSEPYRSWEHVGAFLAAGAA